jgi:hypothetical protein
VFSDKMQLKKENNPSLVILDKEVIYFSGQ